MIPLILKITLVIILIAFNVTCFICWMGVFFLPTIKSNNDLFTQTILLIIANAVVFRDND